MDKRSTQWTDGDSLLHIPRLEMALVLGAWVWLHFRLRKIAAARIMKRIERDYAPGLERDRMVNAFATNTRPWHSIFRINPVGWGNRSRKRLHRVIAEANAYVQTLNDAFTDPSGGQISLRLVVTMNSSR